MNIVGAMRHVFKYISAYIRLHADASVCLNMQEQPFKTVAAIKLLYRLLLSSHDRARNISFTSPTHSELHKLSLLSDTGGKNGEQAFQCYALKYVL